MSRGSERQFFGLKLLFCLLKLLFWVLCYAFFAQGFDLLVEAIK